MTIPSTNRRGVPQSQSAVVALAVGIVVVAGLLWSLVLFRPTADSGSLDARVTAVGETVRCPICAEPIPLNDVYNAQALQMRQFIRDRLSQGVSADGVRQELADRYGATILLSPPRQGFDLLILLVPLIVVAACACAVALVVRHWSRADGPAPATPASLPPATPASPATPGPSGQKAQHYEQLIDRELAARE